MQQIIDMIKAWAIDNVHIKSVIIVGSYACGTNSDTSDLDFCIITPNKVEMVKNHEFTKHFGTIAKKQVEHYGACTSIRVWYESGQEVEFGLVEPSWIATPLDVGTHKVLSDGYKVLVDKMHYFKGLIL